MDLEGLLLEDRILLLTLLGKGASGSVYKAQHKLLDKLVAVKILEAEKSDRENSARRFLSEAQLLSSFEHENIVRFLSFGTLKDGRPYMVLEYLEGKTLAEIIASEGFVDSQRALRIFIQVCKALEYAHSRGILHRDIKAANIFIVSTPEGEKAKLLDFGIFKAMQKDCQSLTQTGQALGSVNYMSPEQCKGKELSAASDIYSLACSFYEALVGKPPMDDQNDLLIMSNQISRIIDAVPAKTGISTKLAGVILKCLEKEPEKRIASASELAALFGDCIDLPAENSKLSKDLQDPGKKLKAAFVLGLGFMLAAAISISLYQHSVNKAVPDPDNQRGKLHSARVVRPGIVITDEDLRREELWLKQSFESNRLPNATDLGDAFIRSFEYRARSRQSTKELLPYADKVIEAIRSRKDRISCYQKLLDLANLARINFMLSKDSECFSYLRRLANARCDESENMQRNRYELCVRELISIARVFGDLGRERNLVDEFSSYANKGNKAPWTMANSLIYDADLKLRTQKAADAKEQVLKAYTELDRYLNENPEADRFVVKRFLQMLYHFKEYEKVISIIQKAFGDICVKNTDINNVMADIKLLAARSHFKLGRQQNCQRICRTVCQQCLRQKTDMEKRDEAEMLLLESMQAAGSLPAGLRREALHYLAETRKEAESKYLSSLSRVINTLETKLDVDTQEIWPTALAGMDLDSCKRANKLGLCQGVLLHYLIYLKEHKKPEDRAEIKKTADALRNSLEESSSPQASYTDICTYLADVYASQKDFASAETCIEKAEKLVKSPNARIKLDTARALLLEKKGDLSGAQIALQELINRYEKADISDRIDPKIPAICAGRLADVYLKGGESKKAIDCLESTQEILGKKNEATDEARRARLFVSGRLLEIIAAEKNPGPGISQLQEQNKRLVSDLKSRLASEF